MPHDNYLNELTGLVAMELRKHSLLHHFAGPKPRRDDEPALRSLESVGAGSIRDPYEISSLAGSTRQTGEPFTPTPPVLPHMIL
jgi:hypothetical protein